MYTDILKKLCRLQNLENVKLLIGILDGPARQTVISSNENVFVSSNLTVICKPESIIIRKLKTNQKLITEQSLVEIIKNTGRLVLSYRVIFRFGIKNEDQSWLALKRIIDECE